MHACGSFEQKACDQESNEAGLLRASAYIGACDGGDELHWIAVDSSPVGSGPRQVCPPILPRTPSRRCYYSRCLTDSLSSPSSPFLPLPTSPSEGASDASRPSPSPSAAATAAAAGAGAAVSRTSLISGGGCAFCPTQTQRGHFIDALLCARPSMAPEASRAAS